MNRVQIKSRKMGAAAGKNLSSGKAQHASVVLASVNDYNASHVRKDLDHGDATLEEFKSTLNAASRHSMSHGKDISESLSQLTDSDLETMRQYVKKKQFTQRLTKSHQPGDGGASAGDKSKGDPALDEVGGDGDDTSVLTYDNDELDEAIDTFDILENSGNHFADIERSMDDRDKISLNKKGAPSTKGSSPTTGSPSSLSSNDSANNNRKGGALGGGGTGNSMLLSLTTSPEGDDNLTSPLKGSKGKGHDRISDLLSRGDDSNNMVWDLENSFDDDMPDSLKLPSTLTSSSVGRGNKENAYMDPGEVIDAKNEALMGLQRQKVWSYTKNAQLQREVDVLHQQLEALEAMEKKLGSSPSPGNMVSSSSSGSKIMAPSHPGPSNSGNKLTPRLTPRQTPRQTPRGGGQKATPRGERTTPRDRDRSSGRQQPPQQASGSTGPQEGPPYRQQPRNGRGNRPAGHIAGSGGGGGGRAAGGGGQYPARRVLRDKLDPFPLGSQALEGSGQNNNSSSESLARDGILQEATPHRSAPQLGTLTSSKDFAGASGADHLSGNASSASISNGDIPRRRRPRRNRLVAMQQHSESTPRNQGDSDDSASIAERPPEAWRQPAAHNDDSDSDNNSSYMQSLGFRGKAGENAKPSQLAHLGGSKDGRGGPSNALSAEVAGDNAPERGGVRRARPRRQRPKGFLQPPSASSQQQAAEGGGSSGPRLAPLPHGPSSHMAARPHPFDQPIPSRRRGEGEPIGPISEDLNYSASSIARGEAPGSKDRPSLSGTSPGQPSNRLPTTAQDQGQGAHHASDSEKSESTLTSRRRRGRNVLQNANRRRRHTMEDDASAAGGKGRSDDDKATAHVEEGTLVKSQAGEFIVPAEKEDSLFDAQPKSAMQGAGGSPSKQVQPRGEAKGDDKQAPREISGLERKPGIAPLDGVKKRAGKSNKLRRVRNNRQPTTTADSNATSSSTGASPSAAADQQADEDPDWSRELEIGWSEVSFVLQRPIEREEDLEYTVTAAEAGLLFANQLDAVAKSLQVLRGTLTRWLLPYDQNTSLSEQRSTPQSVIEHMPDDFRGKLTERQVHYLVAGANSIRKLVRIKIADDNDLEQAKEALKTAIDFFKLLKERASANNKTPFHILSSHLR